MTLNTQEISVETALLLAAEKIVEAINEIKEEIEKLKADDIPEVTEILPETMPKQASILDLIEDTVPPVRRAPITKELFLSVRAAGPAVKTGKLTRNQVADLYDISRTSVTRILAGHYDDKFDYPLELR